MLNTTIDWFITNKCASESCPFCYAPRGIFSEDATLLEAVKICEKIGEKGFSQITLCGGEPLLYPHIIDIVKKLNSMNIGIVFHVGTEIDRVMEITDYIKMISLPIEAMSAENQRQLRGIKLHDDVFKLLNKLRSASSRPRVKIGTVVNAINIHEIENIFYELIKYDDIIDIWRLYMFSPCGIGKLDEKRLLISATEFANCISKVIYLCEENQTRFKYSYRSREANKGYCLIMDSKGHFYRYEEEYIRLDITIHDTYNSIIGKYDIDKHIAQKKWLMSNL